MCMIYIYEYVCTSMYDCGSYWPTTDPGNIRKLGTRPALGIDVGERERDGGEQQG